MLWILIRCASAGEALLTSTHNICFQEEIRKLHVSTFLVKTCINYAPDLGIQSTLIILTSKGLSEILRDIHTSTYQNCRIEKK